jgi:hypothetical protein
MGLAPGLPPGHPEVRPKVGGEDVGDIYPELRQCLRTQHLCRHLSCSISANVPESVREVVKQGGFPRSIGNCLRLPMSRSFSMFSRLSESNCACCSIASGMTLDEPNSDGFKARDSDASGDYAAFNPGVAVRVAKTRSGDKEIADPRPRPLPSSLFRPPSSVSRHPSGSAVLPSASCLLTFDLTPHLSPLSSRLWVHLPTPCCVSSTASTRTARSSSPATIRQGSGTGV